MLYACNNGSFWSNLPIYMQRYPMLSRNLLYTGLTRAKKLTILMGLKKATGLSSAPKKAQERHTLLCERLSGAVG